MTKPQNAELRHIYICYMINEACVKSVKITGAFVKNQK